MPIIPLKFASQSYQNRSLPVSAQRLVNCYCEKTSQDAKTPEVIYGSAGFKSFADIGTGLPIWGMHYFNNQIYVVCGDYVYTVSGSGVVTQLTGDMATVNEVCQMMNNGSEVGILKSDGTLYRATTSQVIQVTDADLPTVGSITYLDSFLFYNEVDSNLFGTSASNDMSDYDALDTANAESDSDYIVRVFGDLGELWLFGERTIEIWYNTRPFLQNSTVSSIER